MIFRREVDAVVFADVADGGRLQGSGIGGNSKSGENFAAGFQVVGEGTRTDLGKFSEFLFADGAFGVVIINHCHTDITEITDINARRESRQYRFCGAFGLERLWIPRDWRRGGGI